MNSVALVHYDNFKHIINKLNLRNDKIFADHEVKHCPFESYFGKAFNIHNCKKFCLRA